MARTLPVLELSADELKACLYRVRDVVTATDYATLEALLGAYLFVRQALLAARVSVARLKRLFFGPKSEKSRDVFLVFNELRRQAAQVDLLHNDDTSNRILALQTKPATGANGTDNTGASRCGGLPCPSPSDDGLSYSSLATHRTRFARLLRSLL